MTSPPEFARHRSVKVHGRNVERGTEFSVRGTRGRFNFVEHVVRPDGVEWITGYGGDRNALGRRLFRSFNVEDIRTIHNKPKRGV